MAMIFPTVSGDAAPLSTSTDAPPRWRYPNTSGRDRRLDLLRGYALAAMAINHFGLHQSWLHSVSGRSEFLVSAAEAFLLISGFTLGYISIGRTPEQVTGRLATRTWTVYLATIGISFGLGAVALTTQLELWGELPAEAYGGVWAWIGNVVTLRTAFNGADILIAYVLYLLAAIAAVRLMTAGRSGIVIAAVAGAYLLSQLAGPENTTLGFASFRALLPNAPLFFGGLLLGFHRDRVNGWWHALPFHRALDAVTIALAAALTWLHTSDWPLLGVLADHISGDLGAREYRMPIVPLLVVLLFLRTAWLIVDHLWVPLERTLGWLLLPLGAASLFTFTMHLLAIPIIVNLPGWPGEDIGRAAATGWVIAYLGVIYGAVRVRTRAIAWLHAGATRREALRRHLPLTSIAVLLVAVLAAGADPVGASGPWGLDGAGFEEDGFDEVDERADVAETVGLAVDELIEGDAELDDVLQLLPADIDPADRTRIAELLTDDPFQAEGPMVDAIVTADSP